MSPGETTPRRLAKLGVGRERLLSARFFCLNRSTSPPGKKKGRFRALTRPLAGLLRRSLCCGAGFHIPADVRFIASDRRLYCVKFFVLATVAVPMASPVTTSSTRRFCCRPSADSFEATG